MTHYIYIDLTSQRIFRVSAFDHRYVPAVLDGVLGMVSVAMPELFSPNACWSKYKGVFVSDREVSEQDQSRIAILNTRCEALELLYKTIYLLRKPYSEVLPLEQEIFKLRLEESKKVFNGETVDQDGYLGIYAQALAIGLKEAAQLTQFLEKDRHELLKHTEKLKLEWERKFLTSENPSQDLLLFKTSVYLG